MKRSTVNGLIREAESTFARHGVVLPPWTRWSPAEWRNHPAEARFCAAHQMGWDITDFGSERFSERGLLLLCARNGLLGQPGERVYAEKIMIVREEQETPFHRHLVKVEDIIVRGGGTLALELFNVGPDGRELDTTVEITVDASIRRLRPREKLLLRPGESVTLVPGQMHRFWGEAGTGTVLVGEVSLVNDDMIDNVFLEPVGRFAAIEEDEPPLYPLWSELAE